MTVVSRAGPVCALRATLIGDRLFLARVSNALPYLFPQAVEAFLKAADPVHIDEVKLPQETHATYAARLLRARKFKVLRLRACVCAFERVCVGGVRALLQVPDALNLLGSVREWTASVDLPALIAASPDAALRVRPCAPPLWQHVLVHVPVGVCVCLPTACCVTLGAPRP